MNSNFTYNRTNVGQSAIALAKINAARRKAQDANVQQVTPTVNLGSITSNFNNSIVGSPNNDVSGKSNKDRLNERVPDIYGVVNCFPDKLTESYFVVDSGVYYEIRNYCVGRGTYVFSDERLGGYSVNDITSYESDVYEPGNTLTAGLVGQPYHGLVKVQRETTGYADFNSLSWLQATHYLPATNRADVPKTRGPYIAEGVKGFLVCIYAFAGGGLSQPATTQQVEVKTQQVNSSGVAFGSIDTQYLTISFPSVLEGISKSAYITAPWAGRLQVSVRVSSSDGDNPYYCYLSHLYGILDNVNNVTNFDATTIRMINSAEDSDAIGSNVNFSMIASREIDGVVTSNFAKIAKDICLDSAIGRLTSDDIDYDQWEALSTTISGYFGRTEVVEFNYTFDDNSTSFQEMLLTVCRTCFTRPYRDQGKIKFAFDSPTSVPRFIFNHRNKIEDSETRTVSFGFSQDRDGVQYLYTDISDGAQITLELPSDGSGTVFDTESPVGITNRLQAYFHAYRTYNRLKYQSVMVQFEATQEAMLLVPGDLIMLSDNTKPSINSGEIENINYTTLDVTLSEPFVATEGGFDRIFIQTSNNGIEEFAFTPQPNSKVVRLTSSPVGDISFGEGKFTNATYLIRNSQEPVDHLFIVDSISPVTEKTYSVVAYNYDERYYANDKDFINGVINSEGF